ncbi:MAG: CapA family protein [Myxococcota bacterium]|nr:CapA family protein [Myxococcota bacterium]
MTRRTAHFSCASHCQLLMVRRLVLTMVFLFSFTIGAALSKGSSTEKTGETQPIPPTDVLVYSFTGDIMHGRYFGPRIQRHFDAAKYTPENSEPFVHINPLLKDVDCTFVNLENPILDETPKDLLGMKEQFTTRLVGAPQDLMHLVKHGVDFVSLANNHINDAYLPGLQQTIKHVEQAGLAHAGASVSGDPYQPARIDHAPVETYVYSGTTFINRKAVPVDFNVAVAPTRRLVSQLQPKIKALREKRPRALIIVSIHWGPENQFKLMPHQAPNVRRLIDAGADVVFGHHPHVLHPVEVYKNGVIFYSLGNLFFDQTSTVHRHGMIAHVEWSRTLETKRPRLEKVILHGIVRPVDQGPVRLADFSNRASILGRVKSMSSQDHRTRLTWQQKHGRLVWQRNLDGP